MRAALGSIAITLLGCADQPVSSEFSVIYQLIHDPGAAKLRSWVVYDRSGGDIPDLDEEGELTVAGVPHPLTRDDEGRHFTAKGEITAAAPGELYDFVLDLPWQRDITVALEMVAPHQITSPAEGTSVLAGQGLEVAWTSEPNDDITNMIVVIERHAMMFSTFPHSGATTLTLTPGELFTALLERAVLLSCGESRELTFPVEVELRIWRRREVSASPPFKDGFAMLAVESPPVHVVLEDPTGAVANAIRAAGVSSCD
jgi:hypothetical protein